jgi:histidinol phosphatase-like enzyme
MVLPGRAAPFLDRDGVIVDDSIISAVEDMRMIADAASDHAVQAP